jgi:hypothetical protein
MNILALDTRSGDRISDLFVLSETGARKRRLRLGYVPELCYDPTAHELVLAETELGSFFQRKVKFWLKAYDASSWNLKWQQMTPERPMYTGYPGRSSNIDGSPSGRYVYALHSRMLIRSMADPLAADTFQLKVNRYDRRERLLQSGGSTVESCTVAFGHWGPEEDELYFHLSCDYPSTVAFCKFTSPEIEWVRMDPLEVRDYSPRETCGSWLDQHHGILYCVAGDGRIYAVHRTPARADELTQLDLAAGEMIPLRQIQGNGEFLFVGVSADHGLRSLSLASEIRRVCVAHPRNVRRFSLPFPVLNFVVSPDGDRLAAVSPYERAICLLDADNGRLIRVIENVGKTPAEVLVTERDQ